MPPGPPPPFAPRGGDWIGMPIVPFLGMLIAVLLASGVSLILIYRSFRDKAELAKEVLGRMQQGDLKARFPISKWDEASQIFVLYNQMADEIERLVARLEQNEKTRVALLQELAHDLRTPVSSLRNVIETIKFDEKLLPEKTKEELKEVALHETEYLSRLVEDLLFLALMLEPKYKAESEEVSIRDLLVNQMNAVTPAYPNIQCELIEAANGDTRSLGTPHLLRRLFRNALENACSFARSKVTVTICETNGRLTVIIQDDGPGLSEPALEMFGKKKTSTRYQTGGEGRLSIGLGSVIMQTIATAHSGQAAIRNLTENGKIRGAELTITLRALTS
jgi:signal transduction histidine kinase